MPSAFCSVETIKSQPTSQSINQPTNHPVRPCTIRSRQGAERSTHGSLRPSAPSPVHGRACVHARNLANLTVWACMAVQHLVWYVIAVVPRGHRVAQRIALLERVIRRARAWLALRVLHATEWIHHRTLTWHRSTTIAPISWHRLVSRTIVRRALYDVPMRRTAELLVLIFGWGRPGRDEWLQIGLQSECMPQDVELVVGATRNWFADRSAQTVI